MFHSRARISIRESNVKDPAHMASMNSNESLFQQLGDVLYGGIKPDIPGHGGEECASYLSKETMIFETLLSTCMMIVVGCFALYTFTIPKAFPIRDDFVSKRFLLVLLCLVFGIEIGYKICSKQVLYLLNPCHLLTVTEVQMYMLKPAGLLSMIVFVDGI